MSDSHPISDSNQRLISCHTFTNVVNERPLTTVAVAGSGDFQAWRSSFLRSGNSSSDSAQTAVDPQGARQSDLFGSFTNSSRIPDNRCRQDHPEVRKFRFI